MTEHTTEPDYSSLRNNVSMLGALLGEVITSADGEAGLAAVENIRLLSRAAREGDSTAGQTLLHTLRNLQDDQLVPVARAFSQFLNLANIADQQHTISREMDPLNSASQSLLKEFESLLAEGCSQQDVRSAVQELHIDLVLTAHPTEIVRRTLIHKQSEIGRCLSQLELKGLTDRERRELHARLRELITQIWFGDDFRRQRPTPVDEAKWGFAVVEDSLWQAVPEFLRRLDRALEISCGQGLAIDAAPLAFTSWMGGDRDGNPNVTATVTREVLLLSRWQAADLYQRDIAGLLDELSMTRCTDALRMYAGDAHEPYREVLRRLRSLLQDTLGALEAELDGEPAPEVTTLVAVDQLLEPLECCYHSLRECGMASVANSQLLDLLRKIRCFGVHLVRHDIRQDSARHTSALAEIFSVLAMGDYAAMNENQRQQHLLDVLASPRPLLPRYWQPSADTAEVLATCEVAARQPQDALGAYVISMARQPSDVLAVVLLLRECGAQWAIPVAPLFETLDDLARSESVMETLLSTDWYRNHCGHRQMVMIGYSDSAKDAGVMAASWAQYSAQESLLSVCQRHGVELSLFHGRGGTIGRGGAPARDALLSQPPGSLRNGLRVTEQGEMIRAKLGWTSLAVKTLALYTTAICRANLRTPPQPRPQWRELMARLSEDSCSAYRAVVRGEPDFVPYFRSATPEQELAKLPLGSRPARRAGGGGIESLRAIPWIFAWSQNRLMLPAWLGAGGALQAALDRGESGLLQEMMAQWPFFAARISMLEMVFAKADAELSKYYDEALVDPELQRLGVDLRAALAADTRAVLSLSASDTLLADQPWIAESIALRNVYTDPLNVLQAELLKRNRENPREVLERAIMVTIAGVAAGMRNTG